MFGCGFDRCGCNRYRGFECGCGGYGSWGGWGCGGFRGRFRHGYNKFRGHGRW